MRLDTSCPRVRDMEFAPDEPADVAAWRIFKACNCVAALRLIEMIRACDGRRWLDANLRPSGEKETEK